MARLLLTVSLVAVLAGASQAGPARTDSATVFELSYRGLGAPDDPLSYRAYWGWGGLQDANDPFLQAVNSRVREAKPVYLGALPNAKWAAVEFENQKAVALYLDVDADGRLSDQEKVALTPPARSGCPYAYAFITPDFLLRTPDQRAIPFRLLLVASSYGSGQLSYMWSPCCILEGQTILAGEPTRLILYGDGFTGSFTTFGSCSFALLPAEGQTDGSVSRSPLSSLIQHKGSFYRVRFAGTHAQNETVRATFEKDTTPTGRVAVTLKGKEALQARVVYSSLAGTADPSIHLGVADTLSTLPAGAYKLAGGTIKYGIHSADEWQATVTTGPAFAVQEAKTSRIELGGPTLSVRAIKEADRYANNPKEQSSVTRGTPIFLTPEIGGVAGESYVRFSQKDSRTGRLTDLKSHLVITGPDGKEVASTDMEYG